MNIDIKTVQAALLHLDIRKSLGVTKGCAKFLANRSDTKSVIELRVFSPESCPLGRNEAAVNRTIAKLVGLQHPAIVSVHGGGWENGFAYLEVDRFAGTAVADMAHSNRLLSDRCRVSLAIQLADLIAYLQEQNIGFRSELLETTKIARAFSSSGFIAKFVSPETLGGAKSGEANLKKFSSLFDTLGQCGKKNSAIQGDWNAISSACESENANQSHISKIQARLKSLMHQLVSQAARDPRHFAEPVILKRKAPSGKATSGTSYATWVIAAFFLVSLFILSYTSESRERDKSSRTKNKTLPDSTQRLVEIPKHTIQPRQPGQNRQPPERQRTQMPGRARRAARKPHHKLIFVPQLKHDVPSDLGGSARPRLATEAKIQDGSERITLSNEEIIAGSFGKNNIRFEYEVNNKFSRGDFLEVIAELENGDKLSATLTRLNGISGTCEARFPFGDVSGNLKVYFVKRVIGEFNTKERISNILSVNLPENK